MKTETLSDKRTQNFDEDEWGYKEKYVRKFIQKLKKDRKSELMNKMIKIINENWYAITKVNDILNLFYGKIDTLAGEELANHSPQEMVTSVTGRPEDLLCECGALEDRHPIIMIADNKDIGCKKFELANHSPAKKIKGLMNDLEAGKFEDTQKGCGKATAKRCLNFQGFYCHNKDCLNEDCPLCPKWEEKKAW